MSDGWLFWKGMTVKQRVLGSPSGIIAGFSRYSYKKSRQRLLGAEARP